MQEATKSSGKLENIKSISETLPALEVLRARTREARASLDNIVVGLRERRNEIVASKEEAVRREQKEKEFEGLKRQREEERRVAEEAVDQKSKELAAKREAMQMQKAQTTFAKPQEQIDKAQENRVSEAQIKTGENAVNRSFETHTTGDASENNKKFDKAGGFDRASGNERTGGFDRAGAPNSNRFGQQSGSRFERPSASNSNASEYNNKFNRPSGYDRAGTPNSNRFGQQSGGYNPNRGGQQGGGYNQNRDSAGYNPNRSGQQGGNYNSNREGGSGYNPNRYGQQGGSGGYNANRPGQQSGGGYNPNRYGQQGTANRTWTPNQSTGARTMGFGAPRTGGFQQRGPGQPGGRPFGPRPAGAGGFARPGGAARPAGGLAKPTERFTPKVNTFDNKKKTKDFNGEKTTMDKRSLLRRGIIEEQEIEERMLTRIFKTKKAKENSNKSLDANRQPSAIIINTNTLTVKTLSEKIGKTAAEIIKQLMVLGSMCTINSVIDYSLAELVAMEFGMELELQATQTFEEKMSSRHKKGAGDEAGLELRPAVVTVMGHVDHGKTSLLDALRKTNVAARESGGITQHIGAYQITAGGKKITFIDTPGHAAFDKMRARGAKITDIAILIVAADDGVMPQTVEAIKHIQNEGLPMIVAINKMDKKEAKPDRIIEQLAEHNVVAEAWGGTAIIVPISAAVGTGLDKLVEMILLVADMHGYKANPNKEAQGSIIDARLDKNKGPIVTVLVQSGTLKIGDTLLAGTTYGKVRGMTDENGKVIKKAGPSMPVAVLGFNEVPKAGDAVYVVDEKLTKQVVSERKDKEKVKRIEKPGDRAVGMDVFAEMAQADKKQLNVIIKGDVSGSVEAIIQSIANITSDEVSVNVISSGVGAVNDNDVSLAEMSDALLIAFNTKTSPTAKTMADKAKIKIHDFKIIYEIFDFITEKMVKMFSPKFVTTYLGKAEVRALFKSSAVGLIAGCMVLDGRMMRNSKIKLIRGTDTVGEYKIESLKIKTNDVKEVLGGFECGIKLEGTVDVKVGDIFECVGQEQLPIIFNGKKYEF